MTQARSLFSFPDPVDEVSARLVAAGVVAMAAASLVFEFRWLTVLLAYGFVARVLTGPTLSPLGLLVTRVVRPHLGVRPRFVAGPPKRFAQGVGAVVSTVAAVLALGLDHWGAAQVLLGLMVVFASLETALGLCVGCKVFAALMRAGMIPETVCERCANPSVRAKGPGAAGAEAPA
ncbi:MAG TPA: DUF4395 domain-containing protein [Acidimicrobiales bacterium]|nr:DUF4395 domain-containing protein [Acidimicrobiales bacterium]